MVIWNESGEAVSLMQTPTTSDEARETPLPYSKKAPIIAPDFTNPLKTVAEFATRPDFPQCALGEFLDMGGYTGVAVEIVNQSLKVRSPEGATRSFNVPGLRRRYSPPPPPGAIAMTRETPRASAPEAPEETQPAPPARAIIPEPDFSKPMRPVAELAVLPDFPQSTLGEFLDMGGYTGVAVEIVNHSLKVRSPEGATRSFNIPGLRRRYTPTAPPQTVEPSQEEQRAAPPETPGKVPPAASEEEVITQPDFDQEVKPIRTFAGRRDFPDCALGEFVDVRGYSGVVVQIVGESVKVRSPEGETRTYDAEVLRKLYGRS